MAGVTRRALAALLAAGALTLAACGGDDSSAPAGGEKGSTQGAKVAPSLDESKDATGTVTFCAGKDNSGGYHSAVDRFNQRYADQGLKARLVEFPNGSDEQRQQAIQRLQAKSSDCDVYQSDVIWIAEFAQQKWIMDLSDYVNSRQDEFIPSTLAPNKYDGRYWAVPQVTGAGLLYRRTDQAPDAPATWQELYKQAGANDGLAYQGAPYEGLTCNFVELSSAAGGSILSEDGKSARFDSPENLKVLQFMVDGVKDGSANKAVTTYMEEPARLAFEAGQASFMRNWSYAYALDLKAKKLKGNSPSRRCPASRAAARAASWAATARCSRRTRRTPRAGCCSSTT